MKKTVVGLTGNMGSGKTTAARMIQEDVIPVFDADAAVHRLMKENAGMKALFARRFPGILSGDEISRPFLSAEIAAGRLDIRELEKMIYPFLEEELKLFFARHVREPVIVLDAPLLFEAGWDKFCDRIIWMTVNAEERRRRVFRRPGMTEEKYRSLLSRQTDEEKASARADYIVDSGAGMKAVRQRIAEIMEDIKCVK